MIPLVCGDPAEEPASYTRFVLPFSYSPTKYTSQRKSPWIYKLSEPASIWRQNYLTVETSTVLFHRAQWFDLKGVNPFDFQIPRNGRNLTIRMSTPRLVLFEWPSAPAAKREDDQKDLLCIGFLVIETSFPRKEESVVLDDLLELNEKFRYWYRPYEGHEESYKSILAQCPIDIREPSRSIGDGNLHEIYFERWASLLEIPVEDKDGNIWKLFPDGWEQEARAWVSGVRPPWNSGWVAYTDNRTFVWTCAIVESGGNKLQEVFSPLCSSSLEARSFGHWIKLLNADAPGSHPAATHHSTQFEQDWAKKRTYHRWEEFGTFYGFNYHCGAMLGPPLGKKKPEPELWRHFGGIYFDQTLLLLYLRVGSFRFSRRLGRMSADARDARERTEAKEDWQREFQNLRWSFALFTNLYEFPLLSNQQQGVEMYEIAREQMDVEEFFREIQEEIRSSHDYLAIQAGQEQTEITTLLTVVATLGLTLGLAIGFWGMNIVTSPIPEKIGRTIQSFWFLLTILTFLYLTFLSILHSKGIAKCFHKLANYSFRRGDERGNTL